MKRKTARQLVEMLADIRRCAQDRTLRAASTHPDQPPHVAGETETETETATTTREPVHETHE
jgi:hypothetical protein